MPTESNRPPRHDQRIIGNRIGENNSNNEFASDQVAANADGSLFERMEALKDQLTAAVAANYPLPTFATGEADVDITAADYTTVGGIALLTITPGDTALADVIIDLDFVKATTGLFVVNTSETVQIMIQSKIDGTNWRTIAHWPATSSTLGLAVPDAAQDLDAADDSPAKRFYVGNVGVDEEIRVTVQLSAETGGDAEVPYAVSYRGATATITAVAAA